MEDTLLLVNERGAELVAVISRGNGETEVDFFDTMYRADCGGHGKKVATYSESTIRIWKTGIWLNISNDRWHISYDNVMELQGLMAVKVV